MKNNFTKNILFGLAFLLSASFVHAQTGLQNIIVEKYYVSDAADEAASIGVLPVGSVTYRIFVDMKQGYKFQAAFGTTVIPDISNPSIKVVHALFFKTTTSFFNNEDRGAVSPTFTKTQAKSNTVMLDSWLSVGAACAGNFGVLKAEDDGVATVINSNGVLKNENAIAGIPLTLQDGMKTGTPQAITLVGPQIETGISIFDATSQAGGNFTLTDAAWSALSGAVGVDTTNKVLIAQLTTDGDFSFELNMQLGTPDGGTEKFVARNPISTNGETEKAFLTYTSVNTGIDELLKNSNKKLNEVSVYPNPTSGKFTLNVKSESSNPNNEYIIRDLIGKIIVKKNIENASGNDNEKIDLSAYPKGLYFIEVTVDGHKSVSKVVKN